MAIYFICIILIIITIILKKKPILIAAFGLLAVGIGETQSVMEGIQVAFRSLLSTATDLLSIILLIGLVVAMTSMLKETGADTVISRPFLKFKQASLIYWIFGITLWLLSLFLWPTPAVTLLGAILIPIIGRSRIHPLGLAVGLCIFGEGMSLSGDYIIQGAPGLLAKSAGIEVGQVIQASIPLVVGSSLIASVIGFWKMNQLNKKQPVIPLNIGQPNEEIKALTKKIKPSRTLESQFGKKKRNRLAYTTVGIYLFGMVGILKTGMRGDSAAAVTGGVTILVIIMGTLLNNYKTALNTFVQYIQGGMRFSMEVFAPVVVIAGFFILGTQEGNQNILLKQGDGYLEQFSFVLSEVMTLNVVTCSFIITFVAILGAMSGSGFSALPLVGGIAAALGKAAGISVVQLAVLGQVIAIWTDATIIPWGFPAVVSAVTRTDVINIVKHNILPWLSVLGWVLIWTMSHYF